MLNKKLTSLSLLLLLGFIWGTGYSIARFATTHGVPPLGYSFWQAIGPAILIGLFSLIGEPKINFSLKHLRYYFICGLTGIVIPNTNMYFAAPHLPAGILAVIVNTVPVIAYLLALFNQVEKFNVTRFIGILCAMTGLMLIVLPASSLPSKAMVPWIFSTLITPFSFAFCAVYIAKFRPEESDSLSLAAGTLMASSFLLTPIVFFTGHFYSLHMQLTQADLVILLEILLSSLGYILFFKLIKVAGPVYYSLVSTIVALTGLFWGYTLFNEKLNSYTSLAVFCILLALVLVTQSKRNMIKSLATESN